MLRYVPFFGWIGIVTVFLFYAAVLIMYVAKKQRKPRLRKYHVWLASLALLLGTIHGIWALSFYF